MVKPPVKMHKNYPQHLENYSLSSNSCPVIEKTLKNQVDMLINNIRSLKGDLINFGAYKFFQSYLLRTADKSNGKNDDDDDDYTKEGFLRLMKEYYEENESNIRKFFTIQNDKEMSFDIWKEKVMDSLQEKIKFENALTLGNVNDRKMFIHGLRDFFENVEDLESLDNIKLNNLLSKIKRLKISMDSDIDNLNTKTLTLNRNEEIIDKISRDFSSMVENNKKNVDFFEKSFKALGGKYKKRYRKLRKIYKDLENNYNEMLNNFDSIKTENEKLQKENIELRGFSVRQPPIKKKFEPKRNIPNPPPFPDTKMVNIQPMKNLQKKNEEKIKENSGLMKEMEENVKEVQNQNQEIIIDNKALGSFLSEIKTFPMANLRRIDEQVDNDKKAINQEIKEDVKSSGDLMFELAKSLARRRSGVTGAGDDDDDEDETDFNTNSLFHNKYNNKNVNNHHKIIFLSVLFDKQCKNCYIKKSNSYCGRCKKFDYCSEECQKQHWVNGHREICLNK